jgi:hypothetical protein
MSRYVNSLPTLHSPLNEEYRTVSTFCKICNYDYKTVGNFNRHAKDKHIKVKYRCDYCAKIFSRASYKRIHMQKKHPQELIKLNSDGFEEGVRKLAE